MGNWKCPHCGTPQPEAARCWVCGRGTTVCATCVHFRRAVAGNLGVCGLDPRGAPLRGDELRPCWESPRETTLLLGGADADEPAAGIQRI